MGDNIVPYAEGVVDRLELDYGELLNSARDILTDSELLPRSVESDIDVAAIASMVVKLRDIANRGDAHRVAEKEPHLRAGDAIQAFFMKRVVEPLNAKRFELAKRIDIYKQRQLAEERARREAEAAALRKQQAEALRAKEAAELAARRARSAETIEQRKAEATEARVEANIAVARAEEATLATMASATQIVGERFEGDRSGLVSMRKTPVVYIDDIEKINLEALRPYLKEEHVLSALKAWAKATNYAREMPGATIGMRDATVVR
jgi:hypothetical protein